MNPLTVTKVGGKDYCAVLSKQDKWRDCCFLFLWYKQESYPTGLATTYMSQGHSPSFPCTFPRGEFLVIKETRYEFFPEMI